jgi:hypothetical protein
MMYSEQKIYKCYLVSAIVPIRKLVIWIEYFYDQSSASEDKVLTPADFDKRNLN